MLSFYKMLSAAAAMLCLCTLAGCSSGSTDESSLAVSQSDSADAVTDITESKDEEIESQTDDTVSDSETEFSAGEKLAALLEQLGGDYTIKAQTVYSDDSGNTADILYTASGENRFMRKTYADSDTAVMLLDSSLYEIDYTLGAYTVSEANDDTHIPLDIKPIFLQIADEGLDMTHSHIPDDTDGLTVEEYTYAGDTYMTVLDLYFDEDGDIKKYTGTYTVEGQDELVETTDITELTQQADKESLTADSLSRLKDFSAMTADERLAFCQETCSKLDVTTDEMQKLGITTDDFKTIDFDSFTELIYTYRGAGDNE